MRFLILKARPAVPPARHPRRLGLALAALAGALGSLALTGCQAVDATSSSTQVRIIAASADAPGLDIYAGNTAVAYNLGFGTVTSYVRVNPGIYTFSSDTAGSHQVLATSKNTLVTGNQYTLLVGNAQASLAQTVMVDQSQAAPSGQISIRFVDQSTRVGPVDVYLVPAGQKYTAVTPLLTGLTLPSNSGYMNVPAGTYSTVLVPAGVVPTSSTVTLYAGSQIGYTGGSATTVILIDQQIVTTPGLQVLAVPDYIPPTAIN